MFVTALKLQENEQQTKDICILQERDDCPTKHWREPWWSISTGNVVRCVFDGDWQEESSTGSVRLEWAVGSNLFQPSTGTLISQVQLEGQTRLFCAMSSWVLSIFKDGGCTSPLGSWSLLDQMLLLNCN